MAGTQSGELPLLSVFRHAPIAFEDDMRRDIAADGGERIDPASDPDHRAGIEHGIASDLHTVAQDRAQLGQPRRNRPPVRSDANFGAIAFDIGCDRSRAKVRTMA